MRTPVTGANAWVTATRADHLLRAWYAFAAAVLPGAACFICGVLPGMFPCVVPIVSPDAVAFAHAPQ